MFIQYSTSTQPGYFFLQMKPDGLSWLSSDSQLSRITELVREEKEKNKTFTSDPLSLQECVIIQLYTVIWLKRMLKMTNNVLISLVKDDRNN